MELSRILIRLTVHCNLIICLWEEDICRFWEVSDFRNFAPVVYNLSPFLRTSPIPAKQILNLNIFLPKILKFLGTMQCKILHISFFRVLLISRNLSSRAVIWPQYTVVFIPKLDHLCTNLLGGNYSNHIQIYAPCYTCFTWKDRRHRTLPPQIDRILYAKYPIQHPMEYELIVTIRVT